MNGATASRIAQHERWRGLGIDLLLLAVLGLLLGQLGPYRTIEAPQPLRTVYWLVAVFGSGLAAILAHRTISGRGHGFWSEVALASCVITPPVTIYIYGLNAWLLDLPRRWWLLPQLAWQVLVVMLLLMTLRGLLWRRVVETRTIIMPPLAEAERDFRFRLSAKRRSAKLIAIEAEDHYVRVHTDAGSELIPMRFAQAVDELARAFGYRVHRSWWVAADAIEGVRWSRGGGEVRLRSGIVAPVSRTYAAAVKSAGWR